MISGSLFNRIRRLPRVYRLLMLLVDQQPRLRAALRSMVNRSTAPVPDLDVDDPWARARCRGESESEQPHPGSTNSRFLFSGYPGLMNGDHHSAGAATLLLVDVSSIVRFDPKTGIQRVVRRLLQEMMTLPEMPFRVEPVYEYRGRYYFARRYAHRLLALALDDDDRRWRPDSLVQPAKGDAFLGLDWAQPMVHSAEETLADWRRLGVSLHFVVYDLLPLQLPQHFHPEIGREMDDWLVRIAGLADSLQCISESVAREVNDYLVASPAVSDRPLVEAFPLGADFRSTGGSHSEAAPEMADLDDGCITCLMVGTLDPRKGYTQALAAFEQVWLQGRSLRLVIVGRPGSANGPLESRLRCHPQAKTKPPALLWLESATDEQLAWLYRHADFLLAASEGEGFGLPLIEAALHGLPVLARDLAVFREVLGEQAEYFTGREPEHLAAALCRFVESLDAGVVRSPEIPEVCSWRKSAQALTANLQEVAQ